MASVTIKNIPDSLLERIRTQATLNKRSMTKEIIYLLEVALTGSNEESRERRLREAENQVEAWSRLAGRWDSEQTAEEEIKTIYERRTRGREIDF